MTHRVDVTDDWPPSEIRRYLDDRVGPVSIAVLPRVRPLLGGLVFLSDDRFLVGFAAIADVTLGLAVATVDEPGYGAEFSLAGEAIEFALAVGEGVTAAAVLAVGKALRSSWKRHARAAETRGQATPTLRVVVVRVDDSTFQRAFMEGPPEYVVDEVTRYLTDSAGTASSDPRHEVEKRREVEEN